MENKHNGSKIWNLPRAMHNGKTVCLKQSFGLASLVHLLIEDQLMRKT